MKILFDLNSEQFLVDVSPSGSVTKDASVLWDERTDGAIRKDVLDSLGGWVRKEKELVIDGKKLSEAKSAKDVKDKAEKDKATRVEKAQQTLQNLDTSGTLNTANLTQAVDAIRTILKDVQSVLH